MEIRNSIITPALNNQANKPEKVVPQSAQEQSPQAVSRAPQPVVIPRSAQSKEAMDNADTYRQSAQYDQPDKNSQSALLAYGSLEREEKRDEIRQLMGVDIYA